MELTLETLTTVVGAVIFIELVLQLVWKPLVKNINFGGYADLANNIVAFVLGLVGVLGAGYLIGGLTQVAIGNLVLVAIVAASVATGAYEVVKNAGRG